VIHPESTLRRYIFDVQKDGRARLATYTAYHAFNRFISVLFSSLRIHTYRHRTTEGLLALGRAVSPHASVRLIDTGVSAFNTLVIEDARL